MLRKQTAVLMVALFCGTVNAGGGGGGAATGGATEITQLMNNTELMASVGHQADMVATQLQQYILQQAQARIQQQNMNPLARGQISQNMNSYRGMDQSYSNALTTTTALRDSAYRAASLMSGEISTMTRMGMSPTAYTQNMIQLSKDQGGYYKQSLDNTSNAMQDVQRRGEDLERMHSQIPDIDSNIKGMQTLATSNMQMTGEMQNMNATLLQMKAQSEMEAVRKKGAEEGAGKSRQDFESKKAAMDAWEKSVLRNGSKK